MSQTGAGSANHIPHIRPPKPISIRIAIIPQPLKLLKMRFNITKIMACPLAPRLINIKFATCSNLVEHLILAFKAKCSEDLHALKYIKGIRHWQKCCRQDQMGGQRTNKILWNLRLNIPYFSICSGFSVDGNLEVDFFSIVIGQKCPVYKVMAFMITEFSNIKSKFQFN
jgi:hypothetical protein